MTNPSPSETFKTCCRCGQSKSPEEFYRSSRDRDGRRSACKDCVKYEVASKSKETKGRRSANAEKKLEVMPGDAMKACKRCCVEKPASEFYRGPGMADGLRAICKECERKQKRIYLQSDGGRERRRGQSRRKAIRHPVQKRAVNAVNHAITAGRLVRSPCERCGRKDTHGHHESYEEDKWLDVVWLCPMCHKQRHREIDAIKKDATQTAICLPSLTSN